MPPAEPTAVATPLLPEAFDTVTRVESDELKIADWVTSSELPSEKAAFAWNAWLAPAAKVALVGFKLSAVSVTCVTVTCAVAVDPPYFTVTVAEPPLSPETSPRPVPVVETEAIDGAEEVQVAW